MDVLVKREFYHGNGRFRTEIVEAEFIKNFSTSNAFFSVVRLRGSGTKLIVFFDQLLKLNPHLQKVWEEKNLEDYL